MRRSCSRPASRWSGARTLALVGAGAALVVAGGVGGFALGHAAAGNDVDESSVVQGTDPRQDGGGFPGRPGFGDRGTPPDRDGTVPGDPDRNDDSPQGSAEDDPAGDGTT